MNFFDFPWQKQYIDKVDYVTGLCIFTGTCVHKSYYFQMEVNLWEDSYNVLWNPERPVGLLSDC